LGTLLSKRATRSVFRSPQTEVHGRADEDEEEKMRADSFLILLAFAAGMAVPVQFAVNAEMRGAVGGPVLAAAISFVVGTLALLVAVLVAREGASSLSNLAGAPWWAWAGGFLGAFYVTASIILTPRLGAVTTVGFIIAGQVVMSVILDWFGLLNLPMQLITLPKLGGAVLVIVGAVLVLRS
jgi:bacterial/archaeal transporter family-2 protein